MEELDLSSLFRTKSQALDFTLRLASLSQEVFATTFDLEKALAKHFTLKQKEFLLHLMAKQAVDVTKASAVKDFLTKLQAHIYALPVLTLSLAFEPTEKTLTILSDWFQLKIKRQVLFAINVDPSLIAGIVIHFNGKFLDYTIREQFTNALSQTLTAVSTPPATQTPPK